MTALTYSGKLFEIYGPAVETAQSLNLVLFRGSMWSERRRWRAGSLL